MSKPKSAAVGETQKLEKLQQKAAEAQMRLRNALDAERDAVARPLLRQSVGKCFKFSNSYGSGENWWLYVRIVSFDEKSLAYRTIQFQDCTRETINVEYGPSYNFESRSRFGFEHGWVPISVAEYKRERNKLMRKIKSLLIDKTEKVGRA